MPTTRTRSKRTKGTNSVYFSESRKRYVADALVGYYPNGRPKRKRTFHKTKTDAELAVRKMSSLVDSGRPPVVGAPTLAEILDAYLQHVQANRTRRTYESYRSIVDSRILRSPLGRKRMDQLSPLEIQSLLDREVHMGRHRSAMLLWQVLRASVRWSARKGVISDLVLGGVDPPNYRRQPKKVWSESQTRAFLRALTSQPVELKAAALVGMQTGLRLSELLGLTEASIDYETGRIEVSHQLQTRYTPATLVPLKTESSRRIVFVTEPALSALREERSRHHRLGLHNPLGLALLNELGNPWRPETFRKRLAAVAETAGVPPLPPHQALRHGFASHAIAKGGDIATVSKVLGHSSISLTASTYQHLLESAAKETSQRLSTLFTTEDSA